MMARLGFRSYFQDDGPGGDRRLQVADTRWIEEEERISAPWGRPRRVTSAAELMAAARRQTGLDDFGSAAVEEALDRLQYAYHAEANLNLFGRLATRWDNLRLLKNLLILRDRERADATILGRPVQAPIFVLGMPRSGTTFLHSLLAEDSDSEVLRCWQAIHPYPDHPAAGRGAGPESVQRQFSFFNWLTPELRKLHPFTARTPQECTELTGHSFQSLRFDTTYDVPSYRRWLGQKGHLEAYRLHHRFLQHLQGEAPKRWVLKSPDHVFAMEALRTVYPDARLIFAHRDPLKVLPSVARLTQVLRQPFARKVDPMAVGRQIVRDWAYGAQRMIETQIAQTWPDSQVFHVRYKALTADPLATIGSIYDHFGLELTPAFRSRLTGAIARNPDGGYGRNVYRFEDFGLDPAQERERYRAYVTHFDVDLEHPVA